MSSSPSSSSSASSLDEYEVRRDERRAERRILYSQLRNSLINNTQTPQTSTHRRTFIERNREEGQRQLFNDYFSPNPVYSATQFRRRFRMRQHLFLRLVNAATSYPGLQQKTNCTGRMGFTTLQKCTSAIRMLAYGDCSDRGDEYLRMSASTARNSLLSFTEMIIDQFGNEYLRSPNTSDVERLLQIGANRGFPGMLGSIDCMHWQWKNCPTAWQGAFQGYHGKPTVILEAIASQDLWIWHSFFGIPGSCNDLNVLHRSPVFDDLLNGRGVRVNYMVNGNHYDTAYYLTDGIYPKWSTFIQTLKHPQTPKDSLFAMKQEAVRKDVERAFGVLQARFAVIRKPALTWDTTTMGKIIRACIILHNMIVEDERDSYANASAYEYTTNRSEESQTIVEDPEYELGYVNPIETYIANRNLMRDKNIHLALRNDLIENIWQQFGESN